MRGKRKECGSIESEIEVAFIRNTAITMYAIKRIESCSKVLLIWVTPPPEQLVSAAERMSQLPEHLFRSLTHNFAASGLKQDLTRKSLMLLLNHFSWNQKWYGHFTFNV